MYGKIFDSMYDSTLSDDWRALITFQQLIVLCDTDGTVDMTPHSIARRTGIPIEHIEAGLRILEAPDPYSRTPDQEGRRIELIDSHRPWGWSIINHNHYKYLKDAETVREQTRKRVKKHREKKNQLKQASCNTKSVTVTVCNTAKRHTDTDTDIKEKMAAPSKRKAAGFSPPSQDEVKEYWDTSELLGDPNSFFDHFTSNGWKVSGKAPMKDWKSAARNWSRREKQNGTNQRSIAQPESNIARVSRRLQEDIEAGAGQPENK